jgi:FkbM family methyltransferase
MRGNFRHYAGRLVDVLVEPWVPQRFRVALQYVKHTRLLRWEPEVRLMRRYARRGAVAIDVGANRGLWTYAMVRSRMFQHVIAMEPNAALTANLESMRLESVMVLHKAVSSAAGESILKIPRNGRQVLDGWASLEKNIDVPTDDFQELAVATIRLDDLKVKDVAFIKIDVEGHELPLLEGARELFITNRPVCLIECRQRNLPGVEAFFSGLAVGYRRVDVKAQYGFSLSTGNSLFDVA